MTVTFEYEDQAPWGKRARHDDWEMDIHAFECRSWTRDFTIPFQTVLNRALQLCPSIAMDASVLSSTPRIAGTRIPVYMVLDAIRFYGTVQGALTSYPQLTSDQVKEALSFAAQVLEQPTDDEAPITIGRLGG